MRVIGLKSGFAELNQVAASAVCIISQQGKNILSSTANRK
jgi:hypothetical protein